MLKARVDKPGVSYAIFIVTVESRLTNAPPGIPATKVRFPRQKSTPVSAYICTSTNPANMSEVLKPDAISKYVVQSNRMVEARYTMSMYAFLIFRSMLWRIHKDDEAFREFRIPVAELLHGKSGGKTYEFIRDACEELVQQTLKIEKEEPQTTARKARRSFTIINLVSQCEYTEGARFIEARFNDQARPFLLNLCSNFTKIEVEQIKTMNRFYDYRLYSLLVQYKKIGRRRFTVQQLKEMMMLEEKYPRDRDFIRRVVRPALDEINRRDLRAEMDYVRQGNKVVALEFTIQKNPEFEPPEEQPDLFSDPRKHIDGKTVEERLQELDCFNVEQIKQLTYEHSIAKLNKALYGIKVEMQTRGEGKPPIWLIEKCFQNAGIRLR